MSATFRPLLAWPDWPHIRLTLWLTLLVGSWFLLVYGGADWLAARGSRQVPLHLNFELHLPFWPSMLLFYTSMYLVFPLAPLVLHKSAELKALAATLALVILVAGVVFLLVPARPGYPPPGELGRWSTMYQLVDWANLDYNMAPSLHVALSVTCLDLFARRASWFAWSLLWAWAIAIAASTLLTHQHHLVDVLTAVPLALLATREFYPRLLAKWP